MQKAFQAIGIEKYYEDEGNRINVLKGVDLHLIKGEMIAIVGASGTGKTTLLHILGTLDRPNAGILLYEGVEVFNKNEMDLSAYAGWIYQDLNNAKIGSVTEYHTFVPAFQKMLARNDGDLDRFYQVCRQLGQKKKDERRRRLNAYLDE